MTFHRTSVTLVLIAMLAGAILRFSHIDAKSVWGDEVLSLVFSSGYSYFPWHEDKEAIHNAEYYRQFLALDWGYFSQRLVSVLKTETQVPFYFFLLNLWLHLFGTSEAALRSLSVSASIASIPVIYSLGNYLGGSRVGLYSAFIFALAPFQIAFAQYNRPYALLGFFSLLSTLGVLRLYEGDTRPKWLVTYTVCTVLGLYTHYLFIMNMLFHWILVLPSLFRNRNLRLRWIVAQMVTACLFLLWFPIFFAQLDWNREAPSLTWYYWLSGIFSLADTVLYFGRDLALLLSVGRIKGVCSAFELAEGCVWDRLFTGIFYIGPIMLIGLCLWLLVVQPRLKGISRTELSNRWVIFLLWGVCIFAGPIIVDVLANSHMIQTHRYFISASGPLYLLVALAFTRVNKNSLRVSLLTGYVVFLLAGSILYLRGFSETLIYPQGVRDVAQHLDRVTTHDDLVLVLNPGAEPTDLAYYLKSNPSFARVHIPGRWGPSLDLEGQLKTLTRVRRRVWFLDDLSPEVPARLNVLAWLQSVYQKRQVAEFQNLSLYLFESQG